jgi:hypothetical protein
MALRLRKLLVAAGERLLGERFGAAKLLYTKLRLRLHGDPRPPRVRRFIAEHGPIVLHGPFAGMLYDPPPTGAVIPKLLGCYECELEPVIEEMLRLDAPAFVDVGSAEGYYAVGFARAKPGTPVVAYDIDAMARHMLRRLAMRNGVGLDVRTECTSAELNAVAPGTMVMADCEGCERDLLDPGAAPALREAVLLVEIHDFLDPSISHTLRDRFRATHEIREIRTRPRNSDDYPELAGFAPEERALVLSEKRPAPMSWFYMRPTGPGASKSR